jgi:hypothetical protein
MAKTSKVTYSDWRAARSESRSTPETGPVTGKERLLRRPCSDKAAAHAALSLLLVEADSGRFTDRHATVGQALDKYL